MRSAHHLTGRFSVRARSSATTTSSGYRPVFMPKPPPTSPTTHAHLLLGQAEQRVAAMPSRTPVGIWLDSAQREPPAGRVVARRAPRAAPSAHGARRWLTMSSETTCAARCEGRVGRGGVAVAHLRRDVVGRLLGTAPARRGAIAPQRVDHRRQRPRSRPSTASARVARRFARFGDHGGHRLADEAHARPAPSAWRGGATPSACRRGAGSRRDVGIGLTPARAPGRRR